MGSNFVQEVQQSVGLVPFHIVNNQKPFVDTLIKWQARTSIDQRAIEERLDTSRETSRIVIDLLDVR